jgi:uncharacterized membrane protein SirB2
MIEFYPEIRGVHVAAILLSGAWMVLRGGAALADWRWPRGTLAWLVAGTIDGTVLTAATMLVTVLPAALFANHWLAVKLGLVALYVVAGYAALLTRGGRLRTAALLGISATAFVLAYGTARTHHPLGWLAG